MYKNIIKVIDKANDIFIISKFFLAMQARNDDALHPCIQSSFCALWRVLKNKAIPEWKF